MLAAGVFSMLVFGMFCLDPANCHRLSSTWYNNINKC